jgi:integrase
MNGSIRCSRCDSAMVDALCNKCGARKGKVYISLYWKKKHRKIREDREFDPLSYHKAERQLTLMRADIDRGKLDLDDWLPGKIKERLVPVMFEKFLAEKKDDADGNGKAPSTVKTYRSHYINHIKPHFEKIDAREFEDRAQVKGFHSALKKKKNIDVNFKQHVMDTLKTFVRWLYDEGIIKTLPPFPFFEKIKRRKISLDREDQETALEGFPAGVRDVYDFGMETGLRPGELAAVQIGDLNLKARVLWVQRTYSACRLKEAPKENSVKPVPLSDRAFEIAVRNIDDRFPGDFLFLNPQTKRGWTYNRLNKYWNRYSKVKVKLNEAIRHSFGTQLAEMGASEGQIQDLMRHEDPRSSREYTHANVVKYRDMLNNRGKVVPIGKSGTTPERVVSGQTTSKLKR